MQSIIHSTPAQVPAEEIAEVRILALVALVVVPLAALALVCIPSLTVVDAEPEEQAGVYGGPGFVDSFPVTCLRTAATKIQAPCGQYSYEAQVPDSATASVVFGDSAITASAGGITRAAGDINGGNVAFEYCRTTLDAGVTIEVRALCSQAP